MDDIMIDINKVTSVMGERKKRRRIWLCWVSSSVIIAWVSWPRSKQAKWWWWYPEQGRPHTGQMTNQDPRLRLFGWFRGCCSVTRISTLQSTQTHLEGKEKYSVWSSHSSNCNGALDRYFEKINISYYIWNRISFFIDTIRLISL